MYDYEYSKEFKKQLKKLIHKNPVLEKSAKNKIKEILENPERYKMLRNKLYGYRRVHLVKSFVLVFYIKNNIVIFDSLEHHDTSYRP